MGSTDLMTYLNYISTWETETDDNVNSIINEQNLFTSVGAFSADSAIDSEFSTLTSLAQQVRDWTIAADATQIAADAAAVAAFWSFGLSMAAFAALEVTEQIEKSEISTKSGELNSKLKTVDTDIAAQINPQVNNYIAAYKANNDLIASKAPTGLDTKTCRSLLMQFLAQVQKHNNTLTPAIFKSYAGSARLLYNSTEIQNVYDALDTLNLSAKTEADVQQFVNFISGLNYPSQALSLIQGTAILIMYNRLGIANDTIAKCAKAAGLPVEEVESSSFGMLDAVGKFASGVAVIMSVVDTVMEILDIVDVVKQCDSMCDQLNGTIKESYTSFFDSISTASQKYNTAIAGSTTA